MLNDYFGRMIEIVFQNEGSGTDLIRVHTPIPLNTWTRVAFTRAADGKTIRIFKNGLHIGGGTLTNLATSNSDPLMVGNYGFLNDPGACEFNGSIDEIKIFDRVLSDAEILSESSTCGLGASPLGAIGVPTLDSYPGSCTR